MLEKELNELYEECKKEGWGGEGENPVTEKTIENVKHFLSLLTKSELPPDEEPFSPSPDGAVSIEWFSNSQNNFSIDIDEGKNIVLAGMMTGSTFWGVIRDYDGKSVPPIILRLITQLSERHI